MDAHIWPCKSRTTSTNIHSATMWGYRMLSRRSAWGDERLGKVAREGQGYPFFQHDMMMMMSLYSRPYVSAYLKGCSQPGSAEGHRHPFCHSLAAFWTSWLPESLLTTRTTEWLTHRDWLCVPVYIEFHKAYAFLPVCDPRDLSPAVNLRELSSLLYRCILLTKSPTKGSVKDQYATVFLVEHDFFYFPLSLESLKKLNAF